MAEVITQVKYPYLTEDTNESDTADVAEAMWDALDQKLKMIGLNDHPGIKKEADEIWIEALDDVYRLVSQVNKIIAQNFLDQIKLPAPYDTYLREANFMSVQSKGNDWYDDYGDIYTFKVSTSERAREMKEKAGLANQLCRLTGYRSSVNYEPEPGNYPEEFMDISD